MSGPAADGVLMPLARDLWTVRRAQRFIGGSRMTVIRLASDDLLLYSPVALDGSLRDQLAAIGRVRYVVAPNRMHHLHVADYFAAYPEARILAPKALMRKRKDLCFHAALEAETPAGWGEALEYLLVEPLLDEI